MNHHSAVATMPQQKGSIEHITPARAAALLKRNCANRPLRRGLVAAYCKRIRAGQWRVNAATIAISIDGELLDGQHRLYAVIETGIAIDCWVITGLETEAFDTIDSGAPRSGSDVLAIKGEKNYTILAAALRLLLAYPSRQWKASFSTHEINAALADHPHIRDFTTVPHAARVLMRPALLCFLMYLCAQHYPEQAQQFFEALIEGAGLERGNPVLLLRERLLRNNANKAKLPYGEIIALTIKAFNAYVAGRKMGVLKYNSIQGEQFPEIE